MNQTEIIIVEIMVILGYETDFNDLDFIIFTQKKIHIHIIILYYNIIRMSNQNTYIVGDKIRTQDGQSGTVNRTDIISVEKSISVDLGLQKRVYFGSQIFQLEKSLYKRKVAYFFNGPINYYGFNMTAHHIISNIMGIHVKDCYGFEEPTYINSNPISTITHLITQLKQPNVLALVYYCGHGTQSSSANESDGTQESWFGVSDTTFTAKLDTIHPTSKLVMIADCCFSDGIINPSQLTNNPNFILISAARQDGPDNTRSALYTGSGGWLTYNLTDFAQKNKANGFYTYQSFVDSMTAEPQRYYNDGGSNLHYPRLITSNNALLQGNFLN